MHSDKLLKIGIACYPLVGGSGILASALAMELAARGHDVHVFSYAKPVRLDTSLPRIKFHPVAVSKYKLFEYADYTLPLAVKIAEVADQAHLDIIHAHYAVPHATAAYIAKRMAKQDRLRIVTTLHGTDTTLLGRDPNYRRAIEYSLQHSDRVTTVSDSLRRATEEVFDVGKQVEVIHNFYTPGQPTSTREKMREELGVGDCFTLFHASNLRSVKRIDLLLESVARCRLRSRLKLIILAGNSFDSFAEKVEELGLEETVIVRENGYPVEDYIEASDLGIYTSETESFCLSILEGMFLGKASLAFRVGGIPEVMEEGRSGLLCEFGDCDGMAAKIDSLIENPERARTLGRAAKERAELRFTAERIVPQYLACYEKALAGD
ncbi:N-acetyl-alpha-D-glucosaminyl L-malate synthase BshA [Pelagicoccus sp. SDUM812002]|uniref:N-acetyl-alpha-D-glucosaminyl L-malate synthase BshA n=1 Tax=Pelagicoccus sp. SDUM812002 TaxID=3041266 RepID=UPI00280F622B|nr:N-acetyl-alpha-D-glucosaminyl L-malate synthase BshA [Pelagicoccus sp. SDUM812002]MDQ8188001.1 N-acetyl-alpha-D-glucosaminyl L-malate synthase BshA [Pelagicoccus sp. SDUM812002]